MNVGAWLLVFQWAYVSERDSRYINGYSTNQMSMASMTHYNNMYTNVHPCLGMRMWCTHTLFHGSISCCLDEWETPKIPRTRTNALSTNTNASQLFLVHVQSFAHFIKMKQLLLLLLASIVHTMYSNQYFNFLSVFFYIHFFVFRFKSYQCIITLVSPIKFVRFGRYRHFKDKTKLFYWFVCLLIVNFLQVYYTL